MTTPTRPGLDDLRTTLAREAASVEGGPHTERVIAVRRRARVRRRRQAYAGALAGAVVVGGIGVATLWQPAAEVQPAGELMGVEVPQAMTSLGWTYRLDPDSLETGDSEVEVTLEAARHPRLLSWVTRGSEDTVTVVGTALGEVPYVSSAGDFADFVLVPPGAEQTVTVSAPGEGLGLATFVLDESEPPAGVGEGALTFRRDVAGKNLLGAALGEPGAASAEVDLRLPDDPDARLSIAGFCSGLAEGSAVRYSLSTDEGHVERGTCAETDVFDPGQGEVELRVGQGAGQQATLRVQAVRDGSEVADGDEPGLRVGVGAYVLAAPLVLEPEGPRLPQLVEVDGKVWEYATAAKHPGDATLPLRELSDVPLVVTASSQGGADGLRTAVVADGTEIAAVENGTDGVATLSGIRVPGGARTLEVRLLPRSQQSSAAARWSTLVVYRLIG